MKKLILISIVLLIAISSFAGSIKPIGQLEGDMYMLLNNMRNSVMNYSLNKATVSTSATTSENISVVNSIPIVYGTANPTSNVSTTTNFVINGEFYELRASFDYKLHTPDITVPTQSYYATGNLSAHPTLNYLFSVDSSGVITVDVGTSAVLPRLRDAFAPLAYVTIGLPATTNFTYGQWRAGNSDFNQQTDGATTNIKFTSLQRVNSGYSKVSLENLFRPITN